MFLRSVVRLTNTRALSTAAAQTLPQALVPCRTNEVDPRKHTLQHVGRYYRIELEEYEQLFRWGGITKKMKNQINTFQELAIMVRQPAVDLISALTNTVPNTPAVKYVLYGATGTGKSMTLAHVLHYGFKSDWVIIHMSWVKQWLGFPKEIAACAESQSMLDLPYLAGRWLINFEDQNKNLLSKLQLETQERYEWSHRETTEKGVPISELINHGRNRTKHACGVVAALVKELQQHAANSRCKLLFIADGVNAIFQDETYIIREDKSVLKPRETTLVQAFMPLLTTPWVNGAVVLSVDKRADFKKARVENEFGLHLPFHLLGLEGFETLDPFVPVKVEPYNELEVNSCLDYYADNMWLQHPNANTPEGRQELIFLSAGNPYQLMDVVSGL